MVYKGLCYKVTLTLDFTWDFLTIQLLLLCIILLNHARPGFTNEDLASTTIMAILMLLKIPLM